MSNPERSSSKPAAPRKSATASEPTSGCSHCDAPVDPLRAARVRIIDDRFHYFCSSECAANYEPRERPSSASSPRPGETRRASEPSPIPEITTAKAGAGSRQAPPNPTASEPTSLGQEHLGSGPWRPKLESSPSERSPAPESPNKRNKPNAASVPAQLPSSQSPRLLLQVSVGTSALSLLLLLAIEGPTTSWVRVALVLVSSVLQTTFAVQRTRLPQLQGDVGTRFLWVALCMGWTILGLSAFALLVDPTRDEGLVSLAGTAHLLWSLSLLWASTFETPLEATRQRLELALDQSVLRISGEQTLPARSGELRPGEDIVVHAGELLPVDASIVAGSAEVNPWLNSDSVREVGPGDMLYAGARLVSGQVRAVVRWTENDRHWLRLTTDPQRRADRHAPSVLVSTRLLTRVAPAVVLLSAAIGWSQGQTPLSIGAGALAAAAVLAGPALPWLVKLEVLHITLTTLSHGIILSSASALDAAGRITRAVFCARGTLLLGEPQLSTLEVLGSLSSDEILALVAGAEQSSSHPIASSVLRAARASGIVPDAVRNPRSEPGLGVTALASDGRAVVVGSRALMLRERVSVARAESRITELEATGRTVLLVALGGHLAAILSFQDGLRKGARAAVQHLLDAGVEPVLLSGDARETCEALASTLDIEHVRPDVLPSERGKEVERLRGGGANVAVVGRSPVDDLPLASATVSIALPSQGLQAAGFDIDLATDEVHKASLALRLLNEHRIKVQRLVWVLFGGGLVTVLTGVALSIPAAWLPFVATCCLGILKLLGISAPSTEPTRLKPGQT